MTIGSLIFGAVTLSGFLASPGTGQDAPKAWDRDEAILFVHGLADPVNAYQTPNCFTTSGCWRPRSDGNMWNDMMSTIKFWGWKGELLRIGYYQCDKNQDLRIDGFGDHKEHHGEKHADSTCNTGSHNWDTSIRHLGYHFAWTLHDTFTINGRCVNVVAHSMGGLITRYAIAQSERGDPDFPKQLCVRAVVTMGTPHAGANYAEWCDGPCGTQIKEMDPGSSFIQWIEQSPPAAATAGGVRWVLMGSTQDDWVSSTSATSLLGSNRVTYSSQDDAEKNVGHSDYYQRTSFTAEAALDLADENLASWSTRDGYWPVYWSFLSFSYDGWACGTFDFPQPILPDKPYSSQIGLENAPGPTNYCVYGFDVPPGQTDLNATIRAETGSPKTFGVSPTAAPVPTCLSWLNTTGSASCVVANPSPGSWILAVLRDSTRPAPAPFSVMTRYFVNEAPQILEFSCNPTVATSPAFVVCSFGARDVHGLVHYSLDWGDGSATERMPSAGNITPGALQTASHVFSTPGNFSARLVAIDDATTPLTSQSASAVVVVQPPPIEATGPKGAFGPGGAMILIAILGAAWFRQKSPPT